MAYEILDSLLVRMIAVAGKSGHSSIIDIAADFASALKDERDDDADRRRRHEDRIYFLEGVVPARDRAIVELRNALRDVEESKDTEIDELEEKLGRAVEMAKLAGHTLSPPGDRAGAGQGGDLSLGRDQMEIENVTWRDERMKVFRINGENERLRKEVEELKARLKHEDEEVLGLYNKLDDSGRKDQEERQAYVEDVAKDSRIAFAKIDGSSTEFDSEDEEMADDDAAGTTDVAVTAVREGGSGFRIADSSIENAGAGPAVDLETLIAFHPFKRPSPAGNDGDQDDEGERGRKRVRAGQGPELLAFVTRSGRRRAIGGLRWQCKAGVCGNTVYLSVGLCERHFRKKAEAKERLILRQHC
nr:hypothetical protein B0A51_00219 [Rachicladosporium sp. CCFEE 5018]